MATSSKIMFKLAELHAKALESLDYQIGLAQAAVDNYDSDADYAARVDAWREDQKATLLALAAKVQADEVTDIELEGFKAKPKPERDRWQHQRDKANLTALLTKRSKMAAKSESLVADENGAVALTKTQLSEFFDL